jgi:hypothetical protein
MAGFDLEGARRSGASDADIVAFLAERTGFDLDGARRSGANDTSIAEFLAPRVGAEPAPAEPAPEPALRARSPRTAARGAGLAVRNTMQAAAALPGALYDLAALPVRGVAALAGVEGPRSSSDMVDAAGDWIGLPRAETTDERLLARVTKELGFGGAGILAGRGLQAASRLPGVAGSRAGRGLDFAGDALASYPGAQMAGAAGSGLAGGTAAELAPDSPLVDMGASLAGGLAGAAAVPIAQGTARGLSSAARMFSHSGQEEAAAAAMLRASGDPETLAARLRREYQGLSGSDPTSGEIAGDAGLLQLERAVRNQPEGGPLFAARDQQRDAVRAQAIDALEPAPASGTGAEAVAAGVEGADRRARAAADAGLASREATFNAAERSLDRRLRRSVRDLPEGMTAEEAGSVILPEAVAANDRTSAATLRQLASVDPQETAQVPVAPILGIVEDTIRRLFRPALGSKVPRELDEIVKDLELYMATRPEGRAPFLDIHALRKRLVELQQVFGGGSRTSQTGLNAVSEIKRRLDEFMDRAALPYELPTRPAGELDMVSREALEAAAQHPDVAEALRLAEQRGAIQGFGPEGPGKSLLQFMRERGGLNVFNDDDLSWIHEDALRYPGLVSRRGMPIDKAMETAVQEGYFPQFVEMQGARDLGAPDPTAQRDAFLDAIREAFRGTDRFPGGVTMRRGEARMTPRDRVVDNIDREFDRLGGSYQPGRPQESLASIRQPAGPDEYGVPPGAPVPGAPDYVVDPQAEGWALTPDMAARYRGYVEARREEGRLFDRGAMGRVTGRGEYGSRMDTSVVAQQFFHGGNSAAGDVRQFTEALGGRGAAARALEAYAAQSLRDYAMDENGRMAASRVRAWLGRHAPALRQMEEVSAKFRDVETAARTAERGGDQIEAGRKAATRTRDQAVRDFERSAARYWLRGTEPEVAIRRALSAGNAEQNMRELRVMMRGDAPALAGLRRAYAEEWLDRVRNTMGQHQDETARLRSDASRRFVEETERAARGLFRPAEVEQINRILADFRSGSMVTSVGRGIGSNTAQNVASLRSMSTAYLLGRATAGMLRGDAGGLPVTLARPFQWLLRAPEQQVIAVLSDLMADPQRAAQLVEKVSARNLDMVRRYAERRPTRRLRDAAAGTAVRAGARLVGAEGAGETQRDDRAEAEAAGFADGGRVHVRGEMAGVSGRGPHDDGHSPVSRWMLPADGEDEAEAVHRMPRARMRVAYTPEEAAAIEAAGVLPARVGQRQPRALGGPDMGGRSSAPVDAGRALGLGVRTAAKGALGLPSMAYDLAAAPFSAASVAMGGKPLRSAESMIDAAGDAVGLPRPQTALERGVDAFGRELGTSVGGLGAVAPLVRAAQAPAMAGTRWSRGAQAGAEVLRDSPAVMLGSGLGVAALDAALDEPEGYQDGGVAGGRAGLLSRGLGAGLRLFHGSPWVFDRFDLSNIGRGEGAQVFGRGHYLTETERLAEQYRTNNLRRHGFDPEAPYRVEWDDPEARRLLQALPEEVRHAVQHPIRDLENADDMMDMLVPDRLPDWYGDQGLTRSNYHHPEILRLAQDHFVDPSMPADMFSHEVSGGLGAEALDRLPNMPYRVVPNLGATYETRLRADPGQLLSLDDRMAWQPREVRQAIEGGRWGPAAEEFLALGWDRLSDPRTRVAGLQQAWRRDHEAWGSPPEFSAPQHVEDELSRLGVPGARYRDGNSRHSGPPSHNVVVYQDAPIEVVRRYRRGGLAGAC